MRPSSGKAEYISTQPIMSKSLLNKYINLKSFPSTSYEKQRLCTCAIVYFRFVIFRHFHQKLFKHSLFWSYIQHLGRRHFINQWYFLYRLHYCRFFLYNIKKMEGFKNAKWESNPLILHHKFISAISLLHLQICNTNN